MASGNEKPNAPERARAGKPRTIPLNTYTDGDRIVLIASNDGQDHHPDWYYNLLAHPETVVELGTETFPVRARVASGEERTEIWEAQKADVPMFAEYETTTPREIPVVILERI